ncbi:MAG TPA: hypothetical protein VKE23_13010, partial [Candidatus Limnocylindria bacterium]|nr:hypothetical protein [Candidatus Limnocylindria bacterium]
MSPRIVERLDDMLGPPQKGDRHRREAEEERKPFAARRDVANDGRASPHLRKSGSVANLEAQEERGDLLFDGLLADAEVGRDLLIREATSHEVHELELTRRERAAALRLIAVHICL